MKPAFVQPLSWIALSILAGVVSPANALAFSQGPEFKPNQGQKATSIRAICQSITGLDRGREQQDEQKTQLIQQGNALYNSRDFAGAEALLQQLIKKYPKDALLHYKLGNVLYHQSKLEEAATEYQQAIRLNPEYAVAQNALGVLRASQGQWEEATTSYKQALALNPEFAEAMANLGEAQWQQGKRTEAIASLEKAKKLFSEQNSPQEASKIEQILQRITKQKPTA